MCAKIGVVLACAVAGQGRSAGSIVLFGEGPLTHDWAIQLKMRYGTRRSV